MSMLTLKCPKCSAEAKLYLAENDYSGPRRCWKCHEFFTINIHNNAVISCEPLSKEEYERMEAAKKAKDKSGGGIGFAGQGQPESPKQAQMDFPQNSQIGKDSGEEDIDIFKQLAGKSKGGIDFNEREKLAASQAPKQEFVRAPMPQEPPVQKPPVKPQEFIRPSTPQPPPKQTETKIPPAKAPPDRFRTFIPLEDIKDEPPKKKKDTPPPDRFNTGVPPQK